MTEYDCETCSIASEEGELKDGIVPATYCQWLDYDVNSQLAKFSLNNGGEEDAGLLNEKWESFALVPLGPERNGWNDWGNGKSDEGFLFSLSDNDFITHDVFRVRLPQRSKPRIG